MANMGSPQRMTTIGIIICVAKQDGCYMSHEQFMTFFAVIVKKITTVVK